MPTIVFLQENEPVARVDVRAGENLLAAARRAGVKGILMAVNEDLLKQVLEQIRPNLQADGGDMEYVGVDDDGVVSLELLGHCAGCPMSQLTLSMGIERILKEHVPGVTRVVAVNELGGDSVSDLFDEYTPF